MRFEKIEKRPVLNKTIESDVFKNFYWDKKELVSFCVANGLSSKGGKIELTDRIEVFLKTGKIKIPKKEPIRQGGWDSEKGIMRETPVINYKNDAKTKMFFEKNIKENFHFNEYLRQFSKVVNPGTFTYGDLIKGWVETEANKKNAKYKTAIGSQFQYNQFQRDFYASEKGKNRVALNAAWNLVRSVAGEPTYQHYLELIEKGLKIR